MKRQKVKGKSEFMMHKGKQKIGGLNFLLALLLAAGLLAAEKAGAALPVSLAQVPVPEPVNIGRFVKDKQAAIRLGKALFWDMQLGSEGGQACASCHFHAGADNRTKNAVNPGLAAGDTTFQVTPRPDSLLKEADFPFFKVSNPDFRPTDPLNPGLSTVLRNVNDVVSSPGVPLTGFQNVRLGQTTDAGRTQRDGIFARDGRNVRRVAGRNTPSVINAVFNFANFWDGRAHHFFNGVNPFGIMDTAARVLINGTGGLAEISLTGDLTTNPFALNNASLASQAVGPPLSDFEMSWSGRSFPEVGKKLLTLPPLGKQRVHPSDSVLGPLAKSGAPGLATTYGEMIRSAFRDEFWNSTAVTAQGFSQMEANFSLFFGLAVQLYEATLVSSDTPFDRFLRGDPVALTERQLRGMNVFFSGGALCGFCHAGPEMTAAAVSQLLDPGEAGLIELMAMGDGGLANYDLGFYNIGVRPTAEDLGRGARVTLNGLEMPLSATGQHFERANLPFLPLAQPGCANDFLGNPPTICPPTQDTISRMAVRGAFKVPALRNVELTGPYMHNGGMATLTQVVDFYIRGTDFREANIADLDPVLDTIGGLQGNAEAKADLVHFLLALTDERVRWEMAPFDHPQLFIPDGHAVRIDGNPKRLRVHADQLRELPAVGAAGRPAQGLPPLKPFLADNLTGADLAGFHFRP